VRVSGWSKDSYIEAISLAHRLERLGAKTVIYTDIARDGVLGGVNVEATRAMIEGTNLNVIASGGVAGLADLQGLHDLYEPRLDGVIVGKALYEGMIDMKDAMLLDSHSGLQ
jgi:phosphoribosylformimino-5-aminoimidazole carboxamide ribotide isomerase